MKRIIIAILLAASIAFPQKKVLLQVFRGDLDTLSDGLNVTGNITARKITFSVKNTMDLAAARVIEKMNAVAGGSDTSLKAVYTGGKTYLSIYFYPQDTEDLTSIKRYYDITSVSTTNPNDVATIFTGTFLIEPDVQTPFDGADLPSTATRILTTRPDDFAVGQFLKVDTVNGVKVFIAGEPSISDIGVIDSMLQFKRDTSDSYSKTAVDAAVGAKRDTATSYSKTSTDALIGSKRDTATSYSKTSTDAMVGAKRDTATSYSKTSTDAMVGAKRDTATSYSKTSTDALIGAKRDTATSYSKTSTDALVGAKRDTATSYSKTSTDALIGTKRDTSTSYSKTATNNLLGTKADSANNATRTFVADYVAANAPPSSDSARIAGTLAGFDTSKVIYSNRASQTIGGNISVDDITFSNGYIRYGIYDNNTGDPLISLGSQDGYSGINIGQAVSGNAPNDLILMSSTYADDGSDGKDIYIKAADAIGSEEYPANGGNIVIKPGSGKGSGTNGTITLDGNVTVTGTLSPAPDSVWKAQRADTISGSYIKHAMQFQTTSATASSFSFINDARYTGDFTAHSLLKVYRMDSSLTSNEDDLGGVLGFNNSKNHDTLDVFYGGWFKSGDSGSVHNAKKFEGLRGQVDIYSNATHPEAIGVNSKLYFGANGGTLNKGWGFNSRIDNTKSGDATINYGAAYHVDRSWSDTTTGTNRYAFLNESTLPVRSAGNIIAPNVLNRYTYSDTLQAGDSLIITLPSISGYTYDYATFNYWVADSVGIGPIGLRTSASTITWISYHTGDVGSRLNYSLFYKPN